MKFKFWGVRGSIPSPNLPDDIKWKIIQALKAAQGLELSEETINGLVEKLPANVTQGIGGNTSCVEVSYKKQMIILDSGSGIRKLGQKLYPSRMLDENYIDVFLGSCIPPKEHKQARHSSKIKNQEITIILSHTHWDHIQGFPFFMPAYVAGNKIKIYGPGSPEQLADSFEQQQNKPSMFPVAIKDMKAEVSFHNFPQGGLKVGDLEILSFPLPHPGGCYGYRVNAGSKSLVYATDFEFVRPFERNAADFLQFINTADAFICDTQYTHLEGFGRDGWGHSTTFAAIDMALRANIKHVFMFHHDPDHSDVKLMDNLEKSRDYYTMMKIKSLKPLKIDLALEGLEVTL